MAMQTGIASSKVIILVGAGLTSSIILRNGRLPDVLAEFQELMKGISESEVLPNHYDVSFLVSQIRQLGQEIKDLTLSRPVTIVNGDSTSSGTLASYILPTAAVGAMGYCYMRWKGWSFSDVMYVTKRNMANAVDNVSKQLEQVSAALATTKKHLSKRLENLDGKLDEQKETSMLIMNEVNGVNANLSQIGFDIESIQKMVSGLEGKIGLLENKQDVTNTGIWHLCQFAGGVKDGLNAKFFQDNSLKFQPTNSSLTSSEDKSPKGLQFLTETPKPVDASALKTGTVLHKDFHEKPSDKVFPKMSAIHRSYPAGLSLTRAGILL